MRRWIGCILPPENKLLRVEARNSQKYRIVIECKHVLMETDRSQPI